MNTAVMEAPAQRRTRSAKQHRSRIDISDPAKRETFLHIVEYGRNRDGRHIPRMVNNTPMCDACSHFYCRGRLDAQVSRPHICCGCARIAEDLLPANGNHGNGTPRRHLVSVVPNRDDITAGRKVRY